MEFVCKRCGYMSDHKHNLKRHLMKKRTCSPYDPSHNVPVHQLLMELEPVSQTDSAPKCKWCHKAFRHHQNKYTHQRKCLANPSLTKEKTDQESKAQDCSDEISHSHTSQEFINLTKEIHNLKQAVEQLKNQKQGSVVHNHHVNISADVVINVNAIGQENLHYITDDEMKKYVCNYGLVNMIRHIHFNPERPENHNIKRIRSSMDFYKNKFLTYIEDGGKWVINDRNLVLEMVARNGIRKFFEIFNKIKFELTSDEQFHLNKYVNKLFSDPSPVYPALFSCTIEHGDLFHRQLKE